MLFSIYYILLLAGLPAGGVLLGSYMMKYTNANSLDLGLVFMIRSMIVFCRVPVCAYADRHQNHKKLLYQSLLMTGLSYAPMFAIPFLMEWPSIKVLFSEEINFWIVVACQIIGSFGFCAACSVGDALAINYAKRVGGSFSQYRKYGALSYGAFAYFLGFINQNSILPDYTAYMLLYIFATIALAVIIYLWPDEYFVMVPEQSAFEDREDLMDKLPRGREIAISIYSKLRSVSIKQYDDRKGSCTLSRQDDLHKCLSVKQQLSILLLLLRRDIRVSLYLLTILYIGLVGLTPQNFNFTYMDSICADRTSCDSAYLSGLVLLASSLLEVIFFTLFSKFKKRINYQVLLAAVFFCVTTHYLLYGLLLRKESPYYFFLEALHGFEYSISLCSCIELGYEFANEVEQLIPELLERGIISKSDNIELVRVSLIATMTGLFTLLFEGAGNLGSPLFGYITHSYSFAVLWLIIGAMSFIGLSTLLLSILVGRCFKFGLKLTEL